MEMLQNCEKNEMISPLERAVVRALQGDFPLVLEPYKELAEEAGVSEEEFLRCVEKMREEKKIRKMGAVLRHRKVGFTANVLCVWEVPEESLDKTAEEMSRHPAITHCYDRIQAQDWPYNLYTMIHANSREECEEIAATLAKEHGVQNRRMLYSLKEWKKTSMKYYE